jgi:hypothetical protein
MKPAEGRECGRDDMRFKSSAAGARIRVRKPAGRHSGRHQAQKAGLFR